VDINLRHALSKWQRRFLMAERKRLKQDVVNPDIAKLLAGLARLQAEAQLPPKEVQKKEREREKVQARREKRVTYDLPPELREQIKTLAEEQHVPASQIVTLALARFMREYTDGKIDLDALKRPSRSPRYEWKLAMPDDLLPVIKGKRRSKKIE
jgi:hypothetical protein